MPAALDDIVQRVRTSFRLWHLGLVLLALYIWFDVSEIQSTGSLPDKQEFRHGSFTGPMGDGGKALVPGELPGYSGWARSEETLAGYFSITGHSATELKVGDEFQVSMQCKGHKDCVKGHSLFFLRAYGPSVISGVTMTKDEGQYEMVFRPLDSGMYTVEVVLSFSSPPPFDSFPLSPGVSEPAYEGYLLPGFPIRIDVGDSKGRGEEAAVPLCTFRQLEETSSNSALSKARWRVDSKTNGIGYTSSADGTKVSEEGYKKNKNSIGIQMSYDYSPSCALLTSRPFEKQGSSHPFNQCENKDIKVIFIGDSVMRVQWNRFDELVKEIPSVSTDYINLYGGYRMCERQDPNIKQKLHKIYAKSESSAKAIIFNTGMHDIHRLCGSEWTEDRKNYIKESVLASDFSCVREYGFIIKDFANWISNVPADLRVFQSTTSAWPKYGNFGIQWPYGAQLLPLDSSFVMPFNEIAFNILQEYRTTVQIMDGFWITHSRPDNREVGEIGKKLSHPGLEVQGAMARIWSMMILEKLC
ncbi:unnamed protein product [Cylindrotheca closterium]|uniref:Uncharacterized protein n=1 Tax=Cylindrotheca closterium TaxID=2856 RepID=A0AAD2JNN4_9STRA|nr:unnamed protein product [Cylindrotheca closterium]